MQAKNIQDIYTLSPTQQGILFHILSAPNSGTYLEQTLCTLHGNLNFSIFERSWQQVVDRHPSLRTGFIWENIDKPVQVVHRQVKLQIQQYDWRGQSTPEQEAQLQAYLQADRRHGFELSEPPLMRLALIKISEDTYQFIWSAYHLVLDAWCLNILLQEFWFIYKALSQGQGVDLKPSRPYRDYIAWLKQQNLSEAEMFWRQVLQSFRLPTPMPMDWSRDSLPSLEASFGQEHILISSATTVALKSLAKQHHLTVNTLVLAAWALLLSYYSGQEDVLFGTVVSGRPVALLGVESMVGLFINTLPMRVQISSTALVLPWLKELQSQQTKLRQYEHTPLAQIQSWSDVPRGLPLFESIFVFQNSIVDICELSTGNLKIDRVCSFANSNYPLAFVVVPGSQLKLEFRYDLRCFQPVTVIRILRHIEAIINSIVAEPNVQLGSLIDVVDKLERKAHAQEFIGEFSDAQKLIQFNNTRKDYPKDWCLHQLFEQQVERSPVAIAVTFEQQQLTYQELNARANQLAHHLQKLGVKPEVLVGICVERSLEMVIGLLGILKAGGAYVPLDPEYPQDRLAYMLANSQVSVLLTQQKFQGRLPEHQAQVYIDKDDEALYLESVENPVNEATAHNLAYVIYTSGSTGTPKGVMVSHWAICHHMYWMQETFPLTETDKVLQKTPFSFDASVWEFFAPLLVGAQLVMAKPQGHQDSAYLIQAIATQLITIIQVVPSLLQMLLQEEGIKTCHSLRRMFCGGEALAIALQESLFTNLDLELHNLYGPTEACIDATFFSCQRGTHQQVVPIGRPIANTQIYILDPHLQQVPIGVIGELHIGGVGLARGYLNCPELSAEKFIPHLFSNEPGARLYKTGDLGRYLADGNIEFMGRIDHQVKLRGFRIELGEIEAVLKQHPIVQEAVVVTREDTLGDVRLIAYIIPQLQQELIASELHYFLKVHLPTYMIPLAFVLLKDLPLTPNGKIDRSALPKPEINQSHLAKNFVPPHTSTEKVIANIWAKVLQLEKVGIHDNFFDLGGNSLLTIPICSKIQETLNVNISVIDLLTYPTVSAFAKYLAQNQEAEQAVFSDSSRASRKKEAIKTQKQRRSRNA
jgi:amino acid adenylation domain-containing protein